MYAHTWVLTSIQSPDNTGWVNFKYSTSSKQYWQTPVNATTSGAGMFLCQNTRSNHQAYVDGFNFNDTQTVNCIHQHGIKEIAYLDTIETPSHIAVVYHNTDRMDGYGAMNLPQTQRFDTAWTACNMKDKPIQNQGCLTANVGASPNSIVVKPLDDRMSLVGGFAPDFSSFGVSKTVYPYALNGVNITNTNSLSDPVLWWELEQNKDPLAQMLVTLYADMGAYSTSFYPLGPSITSYFADVGAVYQDDGNKQKELDSIIVYRKDWYSNANKMNSDPNTYVLAKTQGVKFEYDYSLAPGTPNSVAPNQGKLTLKAVKLSNDGDHFIKSFGFYYGNNPSPVLSEDSIYSNSKIDKWGYYKAGGSGQGADAWSLTRIHSGSGLVTDVHYSLKKYRLQKNDLKAFSNPNMINYANTHQSNGGYQPSQIRAMYGFRLNSEISANITPINETYSLASSHCQGPDNICYNVSSISYPSQPIINGFTEGIPDVQLSDITQLPLNVNESWIENFIQNNLVGYENANFTINNSDGTMYGGGIVADQITTTDLATSYYNQINYSYSDGVMPRLRYGNGLGFDEQKIIGHYVNPFYDANEGSAWYGGNPSVYFGTVTASATSNVPNRVDPGKTIYHFITPEELPVMMLYGGYSSDSMVIRLKVWDPSGYWGSMWKKDEVDANGNVVRAELSSYYFQDNNNEYATAIGATNNSIESIDGLKLATTNHPFVTGTTNLKVNELLPQFALVSTLTGFRDYPTGKISSLPTTNDWNSGDQITYLQNNNPYTVRVLKQQLVPVLYADITVVDGAKAGQANDGFDYQSGNASITHESDANGGYVYYNKLYMHNYSKGFESANMMNQELADFVYVVQKQSQIDITTLDFDISNSEIPYLQYLAGGTCTLWRPLYTTDSSYQTPNFSDINSELSGVYRIIAQYHWLGSKMVPKFAGSNGLEQPYYAPVPFALNSDGWVTDGFNTAFTKYGQVAEFVSFGPDATQTTWTSQHYSTDFSYVTSTATNAPYYFYYASSFERDDYAAFGMHPLSNSFTAPIDIGHYMQAHTGALHRSGRTSLFLNNLVGSPIASDPFIVTFPIPPAPQGMSFDLTVWFLGSNSSSPTVAIKNLNNSVQYTASPTGRVDGDWKEYRVTFHNPDIAPQLGFDYSYSLDAFVLTLDAAAGQVGYFDDLRIIPRGAEVTTYQYDDKGRMFSTESPSGDIKFFSYDKNNKLIAIRDRKGRVLSEQSTFKNEGY